jgi:hypothetical protein
MAILASAAMTCGTIASAQPSSEWREPTTPCGTFDFIGAPNVPMRGADVTVKFDFDPLLCSAVCASNTVAYVQVIRILDRHTGAYMAPHSEQADRLVQDQPELEMNGWSVDRVQTRKWGQFGRFDDGSFAPERVVTGSNITQSILSDETTVFPDHTWFDAISVPVSIDASSECVDRLLGYQYWRFNFDSDGVNADVVTGPVSTIGLGWHSTAFDLAVKAWNTQAERLGRHIFPAMSRLEP